MPARELTPEERRERGIKLARLCREKERRQAEHAEENRTFRDEIKSLTKEIETLSRDVESGFTTLEPQPDLFPAPGDEKEPTEADELAREGDDNESDEEDDDGDR